MSRVVRTVAWMTAVTDLFLLTAAFFVAFALRNQLPQFPHLEDVRAQIVLLPFGGLAWFAMGYRSGLYTGHRLPLHREFVALVKAGLLTALVMASLAFLSKHEGQSRPLIVLFVLSALSLTSALRIAILLVGMRAPKTAHRIIVVGSGPVAEAVCRRVRHRADIDVDLVGVITESPEAPLAPGLRHLGTISESEAVFRREIVDEVIFAVPQDRLPLVEEAFAAAEDLGLDTRLMLSFLPNRFARVNFDSQYGGPALAFTSAPGRPMELALKRVFDVVVSAAALLVLSPVLLAVAVGVRLSSKGPVIFSQNRTGLNGREFKLYKFRSMVVDAEARLAQLQAKNEMSGPVFKIARDPRITGIGHFIRRTSLDELPQFWNVLKGDMSIVGPRPLFDVKQYDERWQCRRLSVKPGITCTWQISGRNQIDFAAWMKLDLDYIDSWSLGKDLKIFFMTIPAVLLGRGAR